MAEGGSKVWDLPTSITTRSPGVKSRLGQWRCVFPANPPMCSCVSSSGAFNRRACEAAGPASFTQLTMAFRTPSRPTPARQTFWPFTDTSKTVMKTVLHVAKAEGVVKGRTQEAEIWNERSLAYVCSDVDIVNVHKSFNPPSPQSRNSHSSLTYSSCLAGSQRRTCESPLG